MERPRAGHPHSSHLSFDAATDTALFEALRDLAEAGTISLRLAEILPPPRPPKHIGD